LWIPPPPPPHSHPPPHPPNLSNRRPKVRATLRSVALGAGSPWPVGNLLLVLHPVCVYSHVSVVCTVVCIVVCRVWCCVLYGVVHLACILLLVLHPVCIYSHVSVCIVMCLLSVV